jgi:hypothetical protein
VAPASYFPEGGAKNRPNLTMRVPVLGLSTNVPLLGLTLGIRRLVFGLRRVVLVFLLRGALHRIVVAGAGLVVVGAGLEVVVTGPLAAVIGALTVVMVVVVVTVLNAMVTGPHGTTVGSVFANSICPHRTPPGTSLGAGEAVPCSGSSAGRGVGITSVPLAGPSCPDASDPGSADVPWVVAALAAPTGTPPASTPMRAAAAARR